MVKPKKKIKKITKKNKELVNAFDAKMTWIIASLVLVLIVGISISYAYFTSDVGVKGKGNNTTITSENILITYDEDTDGIQLKNAYPISDEEGLNTSPYVFNIKNISNKNLKCNVYLIDDIHQLDRSVLNYSIDGLAAQSLPTAKLIASENSLKQITIAPNVAEKTELRLWIKESATKESAANRTFKAHIVAQCTSI